MKDCDASEPTAVDGAAAVMAMQPDAFVRGLVEFAAAFVGMRTLYQMSKVWLRDPAATQRAYAARATLRDHEVVELLRLVTRDLETVGAA